jgi:hypothetical protein
VVGSNPLVPSYPYHDVVVVGSNPLVPSFPYHDVVVVVGSNPLVPSFPYHDVVVGTYSLVPYRNRGDGDDGVENNLSYPFPMDPSYHGDDGDDDHVVGIRNRIHLRNLIH